MEFWYEWERRGRGWHLWPAPVHLEPPFRPFLHSRLQSATAPDDGRTVSVFDAFVERVAAAFETPSRMEPLRVLHEPEPDYLDEESALAELQMVLPPDAKVPLPAAEQFLLAAPGPLAFEMIGTPTAVIVQFACPQPERHRLAAQIQAYVPEALLLDSDGFLERHWHVQRDSAVVEFGLAAEFMRPLRSLTERDGDAQAAIVAALSTLQDQEVALVQVLAEPVRHPWAESIYRAVMDGQGGSFFTDAPEMLPLAKDKIARPLFAAVIRIAVQAQPRERLTGTLSALAATFQQFARSDSNELVPLVNDDYPEAAHSDDLLLRRSRRSGMLLNVEELASLVHAPSASVRCSKLVRHVRRTKPAPATGDGLVLGDNVHAGRVQAVAVSPEHRRRHLHIVGGTGTGKSTLLVNLILQDLQAGQGFAVMDPHGDLIDEVLGRTPDARLDDVVLIDPSDTAHPIGFNPLQAHGDLERTLLLSDLVAVFRRLSTSWGDQMHSVLANAIAAVLESESGGTLVDLRRLLVEPDFRRSFLATVRDPEIVYYWTKEFPLLTGRPHASLLTRLDTFLRPKLIRGMVTQAQSLDLGALMNGNKVVFIKLAQGAIGEENATLLGSLFVTKFHQLALARYGQRPDERSLFTLYVDEFAHFVTPSMASLLTGARKFGIGLVLAHQELRQLWNQDRDVASAVLANAGVRVCFRVGDDDAKQLAEGLGEFTAEDLRNLGVGETICRIERPEWTCNVKTVSLAPVDEKVADARRREVTARSQHRYGGTPYQGYTTREAEPSPLTGPVPAPGKRAVAAARVGSDSPAKVPSEGMPEPPKARLSPTPGRGGRQHKYLQQLIARLAQERGWKATPEAPLPGGGSLDVALERDERRVAFQVSVTTTPDYEMEGVLIALRAGFQPIVVVAAEARSRRRLADLIQTELAVEDQARVLALAPEDIPAVLDGLALPSSGPETVFRGYRVRTRAAPGRSDQSAARTVTKTILEALARLGGPSDGKS